MSGSLHDHPRVQGYVLTNTHSRSIPAQTEPRIQPTLLYLDGFGRLQRHHCLYPSTTGCSVWMINHLSPAIRWCGALSFRMRRAVMSEGVVHTGHVLGNKTLICFANYHNADVSSMPTLPLLLIVAVLTMVLRTYNLRQYGKTSVMATSKKSRLLAHFLGSHKSPPSSACKVVSVVI